MRWGCFPVSLHNGQKAREDSKYSVNPHGDSKCWRVSYKDQLVRMHARGGVFIQVIEASGKLGPGQVEEQKWAKELGMECYFVFDSLANICPGMY